MNSVDYPHPSSKLRRVRLKYRFSKQATFQRDLPWKFLRRLNEFSRQLPLQLSKIIPQTQHPNQLRRFSLENLPEKPKVKVAFSRQLSLMTTKLFFLKKIIFSLLKIIRFSIPLMNSVDYPHPSSKLRRVRLKYRFSKQATFQRDLPWKFLRRLNEFSRQLPLQLSKIIPQTQHPNQLRRFSLENLPEKPKVKVAFSRQLSLMTTKLFFLKKIISSY